VKLLLKPIHSGGASVPKLISSVKSIAQGKVFSLIGFDRFPDISEAPTGILSADVEAALFLKSSVHAMFISWFGMEPSTIVGSEKPDADVLVIMESDYKLLTQKLQSDSLQSQGPAIAIVLCNAYPPAFIPTTYGSIRVFYVPQP
jgi:hypothetical protein